MPVGSAFQPPLSSTTKPAEKSYSFAYDSAGNPAQVPVSKPRIATISELKHIVRDFKHAARNLKQAGFDAPKSTARMDISSTSSSVQ